MSSQVLEVRGISVRPVESIQTGTSFRHARQCRLTVGCSTWSYWHRIPQLDHTTDNTHCKGCDLDLRIETN